MKTPLHQREGRTGDWEKIQEVALAGLLHDIGKFSQRAGNEQRWKHEEFTEAFL